MDWTVDSGWFIFTMILLFANIIYIIIRSWDIIRRARKEKREEKQKAIVSSKKKLQKEIDIQFVNLRAKVFEDPFYVNIDFSFDIRNMGNYETTVHLNEIHLITAGRTADRKQINKRIYFKGRGRTKTLSIKFLLPPLFGRIYPITSVFTYSYINTYGEEMDVKTNQLNCIIKK